MRLGGRVKRIISLVGVLKHLAWLPSGRRAGVIIVDRVGAEVMRMCVPEQASVLLLPVRNERRYVNFAIIFHMVRLFPDWRGKRMNLLGLYVAAVANSVSAKVLLTFIDNNNWDRGVSECANVRVINVQNGIRTRSDLCRKAYDIFYAFGTFCMERVVANEFYPCGSVKAGIALIADRERSRSDVFDLLFASQFRPVERIGDRDRHDQILEAHARTLDWLSRLVRERRLRLGIAFNSATPKAIAQEQDFIKKHCAADFDGFYRNDDPYASYKAILRARVVVSFGSALLYEAIGLNKRIIIAYRLLGTQTAGIVDDWFSDPEFSRYVLPDASYGEFARMAEELLDSSDKQEFANMRRLRDLYSNLDHRKVPHLMIGKRIGDLLTYGQSESNRAQMT